MFSPILKTVLFFREEEVAERKPFRSDRRSAGEDHLKHTFHT
jgi:hypothetical protein